jgi:hypothetical protein
MSLCETTDRIIRSAASTSKGAGRNQAVSWFLKRAQALPPLSVRIGYFDLRKLVDWAHPYLTVDHAGGFLSMETTDEGEAVAQNETRGAVRGA